MEPMQDKLFDKDIRDMVHNYEPQVPADLWKKIESELDGNRHKVVEINSNKTGGWWLKIAAAIVALLGGISWLTQQRNEVLYLHADKSNITVTEEPPETFAQTTGKSNIEFDGNTSVLPHDAEAPIIVAHFASERMEEPVLYAETGKDAARERRLDQEVSGPLLALGERSSRDLVFVREIPLAKINGGIIEASTTQQKKKTLMVSDLLNYVVAPMNKGEEKVLSFTNDDEGSIRLAISLKALKARL